MECDWLAVGASKFARRGVVKSLMLDQDPMPQRIKYHFRGLPDIIPFINPLLTSISSRAAKTPLAGYITDIYTLFHANYDCLT